MRTALLAGLLLVSFAAPGFAQMQDGQPDQGQSFQRQGQEWRGGPPGPLGRFMRGRQMEGMMAMAHELGAGAFYRFRRGNDEVDIHCPSNQPIQECVNAATTLMQALRQNESGAATGQGQGQGQGTHG